MDDNDHIYQIFITPGSKLNFLLTFFENGLLIIDVIFIKFYQKIQLFN